MSKSISELIEEGDFKSLYEAQWKENNRLVMEADCAMEERDIYKRDLAFAKVLPRNWDDLCCLIPGAILGALITIAVLGLIR